MLFAFTSTRMNRSLVLLLNCLDVPVPYTYQEEESSFTLALTPAQLPALVEQLHLFAQEMNEYLEVAVRENHGSLEFAKWAASLPVACQCGVLKERYFDFEGTAVFLQNSLLVFFLPPPEFA